MRRVAHALAIILLVIPASEAFAPRYPPTSRAQKMFTFATPPNSPRNEAVSPQDMRSRIETLQRETHDLRMQVLGFTSACPTESTSFIAVVGVILANYLFLFRHKASLSSIVESCKNSGCISFQIILPELAVKIPRKKVRKTNASLRPHKDTPPQQHHTSHRRCHRVQRRHGAAGARDLAHALCVHECQRNSDACPAAHAPCGQ